MASPDPDVTIAFRPPSPLSQDAIHVEIKSENNRHPLPPHLEQDIAGIWKERQKANLKLWNGSKFRLNKVESFPSGKTTLSLGLTDYRDYLGTNWAPAADEIRTWGRDNFANSQAGFSDPLGVGALLITQDEDLVLIKRSHNCAEAQGKFDIPGGHPEPSEILADHEIGFSKIDFKKLDPFSVVDEVFKSILKEIRDEVNIPLAALSPPLFLGVARNRHSAWRPSAEFLVRTKLSTSQVKTLYAHQTQAEAEESTDIAFINKQELLTSQERHPIWSHLAPSAKGCFILAKALS